MMEEQNQLPMTPPGVLAQRRILALSVRGDNVWRISEPVLLWMIENGDEDLQQKAASTLLNWEVNQGWFIEWGNNSGYFMMAEKACHDLHNFKQAMKAIPADNPGMQRLRELALMTGEIFNTPGGGFKQSGQRKQRRGRRR